MRKEDLAPDEYYHVYNRGVDKRPIVMDEYDSERFIQSLIAFNTTEQVGSLYELSFMKDVVIDDTDKLVQIISYCLNPNHFHLQLKQLTENGISKFMQKVTGGYSSYFNKRHKRTGCLFQGRFKTKHIDNNNYLLHLSTYINLNDKIHSLGVRDAKLVRNSWEEYVDPAFSNPICNKDIILGQFKHPGDYEIYALDELPYMREKRSVYKELEEILME